MGLNLQTWDKFLYLGEIRVVGSLVNVGDSGVMVDWRRPVKGLNAMEKAKPLERFKRSREKDSGV